MLDRADDRNIMCKHSVSIASIIYIFSHMKKYFVRFGSANRKVRRSALGRKIIYYNMYPNILTYT